MTYTIGLTGNIACGKSTVGRILIELGADYVDTDAVVHQLLGTDTPEAQRIVDRFGDSVRAPGGGIQRAALGAIVFTDRDALRDLERILYPRVEAIVHERIARTTAPVIVVDGVKIVESGFADEMDELWVVVCSPEAQIDRLTGDRMMSAAEAQARLDSQPPLESKLARADVVIDNSGTREETTEQVRNALRRALERIQSDAP